MNEKEKRVFDSIRDVEPVKHGYGYRWRFKGSLEPVTREIKGLSKQGLLEVREMAFGPALVVKHDR